MTAPDVSVIRQALVMLSDSGLGASPAAQQLKDVLRAVTKTTPKQEHIT